MKNVLVILLVTAFFTNFGCKNDSKPTTTTTVTGDGDTIIQEETGVVTVFEVENDKSSLKWKGSKPTGSHNGSCKILFGRMAIDKGVVYGAQFTIDMQSLTVDDLSGSDKTDLEADLKSQNFFMTDKYPSAQFDAMQIQPADPKEGFNYTFTGPLRIKDVTKTVSIPAMVTISDTHVEVKTPTFTINRTEWGINYRSGVINTVKDKLISDEIEFSAQLSLKPRDI